VTGNKMYPVFTVRDSSVRKGNDVGGFAASATNLCTVMIWNYHDDDSIGLPEQVAVQVSSLPSKKITITQYRIDKDHSNAYEVWKQMGSPQQPTKAQITTLEKAGMLQVMDKPVKMDVKNGILDYHLSLPGQAVALLKMEW
jgi:xylan 1,4-beta-xylosidase